MRRSKLAAIMAGVTVWAFSLASVASAQRIYDGRDTGIVDAGTNITVRTNERISANGSDGRVYSGVVAQDVKDRRGDIIIPRGSDVELIVRELSNNDFVLDLDSVNIYGRRYGIEAESDVVTRQKPGVGVNKRTGEYAGAGAVLGAIVGAIAGGGKGAAIGAGAGAAAGIGGAAITRGRTVEVPAESLLTFRLAEPLRAGVADRGYERNGFHYHHGYGADRYPTQQAYREKPGAYSNGHGMISIGRDNNISWQGEGSGNVYVQVDNGEPALFSSGQSGVQPAPWMTQGHLYVFTFQDAYGNVIARDQLDLR
jgi:hypothetical protein